MSSMSRVKSTDLCPPSPASPDAHTLRRRPEETITGSDAEGLVKRIQMLHESIRPKCPRRIDAGLQLVPHILRTRLKPPDMRPSKEELSIIRGLASE